MLPLNDYAREVHLSVEQLSRIENLYEAMEKEYDQVATAIGLCCQGCPDNCCDSFFLHHTYVEWAYLWHGLRQLPVSALTCIQGRAAAYVEESRKLLEAGQRPQLTCPLLTSEGLCGLYRHRLMICRMHGVPNSLTLPDGQKKNFSGCFRCREMIESRSTYPSMDRTRLYRELAGLENDLFNGRRHLYPRIKLTIAEMIAGGPPRITGCPAED